MRPVRALVVAAVGVAFWAGWRGAAVRDELAAEFTPVAARSLSAPPVGPMPPAFVPPDPSAPAPAPAPGGTPEVMVYSYPASPGALAPGTPPGRVWRVSARSRTLRSRLGMEAAANGPRAGSSGAPVRRAPETPPNMRAAAYEAATRAYADLRVGDRRGAAGAFAVALSLSPDHPNAAAWRREAQHLSKHWRIEVYTFLRQADGTRAPLPSATPVLGAGASAGTIAYTFNPLSRRTVELQARFTTPYRGFSSPDGTSSQGAVGVAVRVFPHIPVTLVAERLFKLGPNARNDFQARLVAGAARRVHGFDLSAFGEAGVVGRRPDTFAGAQLIAEKPVRLPGGFGLGLGAGVWGAMQRTDTVSSRMDVGPSIRLSSPKGGLALRVDYRAKVAGNARPGNGVAATLSSGF